MSEYKFGELVKARLSELKMSQNELAKRVQKGRSYINYVVSGKNRTARNKQFRPSPGPVERIARCLAIPLDEAFAAAGWHQYVGTGRPDQGPPVYVARKSKEATEQTAEGVSSAREVTIELSNNDQIIFRHPKRDLTTDEIERFTLAFRVAYETAK